MANNQPHGTAITAAGTAAAKDTFDTEERLEDGLEQLKELHLQVSPTLRNRHGVMLMIERVSFGHDYSITIEIGSSGSMY